MPYIALTAQVRIIRLLRSTLFEDSTRDTDFDFCRNCYFSSPPAEHAIESHDFTHIMLVRAAWCQSTRVSWLGFTARETKKRVLDRINSLASTKLTEEASDKNATNFEASNGGVHCQRCAEPIVYGQHPFYVCVEYSCNHKGENSTVAFCRTSWSDQPSDVMLCDSCAWTNDYPEGTSHRWWHTLLPFDSRVVAHEPVNAQSSPPPPSPSTPAQSGEINTAIASVNGQTMPVKPFDGLPPANATSLLPDLGGLTGVIASVRKLDDRMSSLEGKVNASLTLTSETITQSQVRAEERMGALEDRMASVEGKLDALLGELKRGMEALLGTRS